MFKGGVGKKGPAAMDKLSLQIFHTSKKGQAAMEFLMTYGWAILAGILVVGMLAVFGIFSPNKLTPTGYIISAPFNIPAGVISGGAEGSRIEFDFINGAGEGLIVTRIKIDGCGDSETGSETESGIEGNITGAGEFITKDSETVRVVMYCENQLVENSNFKGDVVIYYKKLDGMLEMQSSGIVEDKVR